MRLNKCNLWHLRHRPAVSTQASRAAKSHGALLVAKHFHSISCWACCTRHPPTSTMCKLCSSPLTISTRDWCQVVDCGGLNFFFFAIVNHHLWRWVPSGLLVWSLLYAGPKLAKFFSLIFVPEKPSTFGVNQTKHFFPGLQCDHTIKRMTTTATVNLHNPGFRVGLLLKCKIPPSCMTRGVLISMHLTRQNCSCTARITLHDEKWHVTQVPYICAVLYMYQYHDTRSLFQHVQ